MSMTLRRLVAALLVMNSLPMIGRTEEVHYDVFVTSKDGGIVIGGFNDGATGADIPAVIPADQLRVFGGEAIGTFNSSAPYESEAPGEPGFRASTQADLNNAAKTDPANTYTALPGSTALNFSFLPFTIGSDTRNLFFWNGTGAVAFAPVASAITVNLQLPGGSGWTQGINGGSNGVIAGNNPIATTGASGTIHTHLFTQIANGGSAPTQGFYLFSLGFQMTGLTDSLPVYFVFGAVDPANVQGGTLADFETAHGAAEAWVESNLVAVPEPSSLVLAGLGGVGMAGCLVRRRLRRAAG